jgi:hypothetical protein
MSDRFTESVVEDARNLDDSYAVELGIAWRPFGFLQIGGGWAWAAGGNLPGSLRLSADLILSS